MPGAGLDDPDQEQGEPAEQDVGADPVLEAVVDRAQVDDVLHVAPGVLDGGELLVAQRHVLRGLRCGSEVRSRYLPSSFASAVMAACVEAQQPAGGDAQVPVQAGLGGDHPPQLGALALATGVRAVDELAQLVEHVRTDGGVPFGGVGVVADDEPLVLGDADFLDAQVVRDGGVAARPGQRGGGLGRIRSAASRRGCSRRRQPPAPAGSPRR